MVGVREASEEATPFCRFSITAALQSVLMQYLATSSYSYCRPTAYDDAIVIVMSKSSLFVEYLYPRYDASVRLIYAAANDDVILKQINWVSTGSWR